MRGVYRLLVFGACFAIAGSFDSLAAQQKASAKAPAKAPAVIVLKGAPIGGVKFAHAEHEKKAKCETCHHASLPAKPLTSPHQQCADCHTKPAAAPMKTSIRDAFHDTMAKKGTCVDCHVKGAATGKVTPAKCVSCHNKANV
jgi:hypothetical protein